MNNKIDNTDIAIGVENYRERKESKVRMTCTLGEMVNRVSTEPKVPMLYSAIKEGSVGLVYGVAKTGKTIFCENLGMSIAAGRNKYLGKPINTSNNKVLFVSFEEFYSGRTNRNITQLKAFSEDEKKKVKTNFFVVTENAPKVLSSKEDWSFLRSAIKENNPGIVFLDSLTRIVEGQIENSDTAKTAMLAIREIADEYKITICLIHHSTKMDDEKAMTQQNVAGSRVISQETDFIIGINRTRDNVRYIKLVSARYADDNVNSVATFELDDNLWIRITGVAKEQDLLFPKLDRRKDNSNFDLLLSTMKAAIDEDGFVSTSDIKKTLVTDKIISEKAMHELLGKALDLNILSNPSRGKYTFVK